MGFHEIWNLMGIYIILKSLRWFLEKKTRYFKRIILFLYFSNFIGCFQRDKKVTLFSLTKCNIFTHSLETKKIKNKKKLKEILRGHVWLLNPLAMNEVRETRGHLINWKTLYSYKWFFLLRHAWSQQCLYVLMMCTDDVL